MKNDDTRSLIAALFARLAVRSDNGQVDRDATLEAVGTELDAFLDSREGESERILSLVNEVFDSQPAGIHITLPTLAGVVVERLNLPLAERAAMADTVKEHVRSAAGAREGGAIFGISKGPGAGVCRWATTPVKEPKATK
jgi:hypothetical protein